MTARSGRLLGEDFLGLLLPLRGEHLETGGFQLQRLLEEEVAVVVDQQHGRVSVVVSVHGPLWFHTLDFY